MHTATGYNIRKYIPSDLGGILHVFDESVRGLCAGDYSPSQLKAWTACADPEKWKCEFIRRNTFVAEKDGIVVGFCDAEENGHIDRLYVLPDHAGKGVGSALVKAAEDNLGVARISVEASVTARPFFEKLAYTVTEKQSVFRNGEYLTNFKMEKLRHGK